MRVAIYARVSSERQAEKELSIPAQVKALKKYAFDREWEVVAEFVDEAESARSANRPAFKQMITSCKNKDKPFDAILVWKLSRFARNREDSVIFKSLLKRREISVVSMNEQVDESPAGYLLEGIIEVIDEFYSANLAQDTLRGMKENACRGFRNGGTTPFGYKRAALTGGGTTKSTLEPDENEAPIVARAFDLAFQCKGAKEVAKGLNASGFRTRTGRTFGATGVNNMLRNASYVGTLVWNQYSSKSRTRRRSGEPDIVRVPACHPPLVSEEVFEQVQQMLTARRPTIRHPRAVSSLYLLSGLAHCGLCGSAAIGTNGKSGKFLYYSCNNRFKKGRAACAAPSVNAKALEGFVTDRIQENILTEENLRELVELTNEEMKGNRRQARSDLARLERSIEEVSLKLTRLYAALESGKVDIDDLAPRLKELRAEQRALGERRDQALAEANEPACRELDLPKIREYAGEMRSLLESSTFLESKTFLGSFVRKVEFTKREVAIEYTAPVPTVRGMIGDREVLNPNRIGCPAWVRTRDFSSKG